MPAPADPLALIPEQQRRRLKQLADEEQAAERRKLLWAKRLALVFGALIAIYLAAVLLGFSGPR